MSVKLHLDPFSIPGNNRSPCELTQILLVSGAPTAAVLALFNPARQFRVIDRNPDLIRKWNSSHCPFEHEPGLCHLVGVSRDGIVETNIQTEGSHEATRPAREANLTFSTNTEWCLKNADMVFLCVETPTKTGGAGSGVEIDTKSLECAVAEVAIWGKKGVIVVVKSTVPVGTAEMARKMVSNFFH
jgi:UDPglucose 6-dehydrogenase